MKFTTNPYDIYPPHLGHVATLPWKIKNSNFLQIWEETQTNSINQSINLFRYTQKAYSSQNHNSKNIHIMCNGLYPRSLMLRLYGLPM